MPVVFGAPRQGALGHKVPTMACNQWKAKSTERGPVGINPTARWCELHRSCPAAFCLGFPRRACWNPVQHPVGADVLIDIRPVNAFSRSNDFETFALRGGGA